MWFIDYNFCRTLLFPLLLLVLLACSRDPAETRAKHMNRGDAYFEKEEFKKAIIEYKNAVECGPGNLRARILLSEIYITERAPDLALEQLNVILAKEPDNYRAHALKGNAHILKRDAQSARQAYLKAAELHPDDPVAYYQLATLDRYQRRFSEAMDNLDKVLALKTDHVPALAAKVSLYMAQKEPAKALSFLDEKIRENENNPRLAAVLHQARGSVLFSGKDYEQSEASFKKALELNPDLAAPYLLLARIYLKKNETGKAIAQYREILEKQPGFIQAHMALGAIYDADGKTAEARKMYEKALEINPDFAPAANNLAWLLLQEGLDPDRALNLAKKAKAQLPDDPSVADTLGLAFIAKGLYDSAISELSDAAEKMPQNPTVLYHLALAHWKNDEKGQALEALHDALKIKDAFPERQAARELLEEIESAHS